MKKDDNSIKHSSFSSEEMKINSDYLAGRDITINQYGVGRTKEEKNQNRIWKWLILCCSLLIIMLAIIIYQQFSNKEFQTDTFVEEKKDTSFEQLEASKGDILLKKNKKDKVKKDEPLLREKLPNNDYTKTQHSTVVHTEQKKEELIVRLGMSNDFMDGQIFVDGKKATIVDDNDIFKEIIVIKKNKNHQFQIINGKDTCSTSVLILKNNQKIDCSNI